MKKHLEVEKIGSFFVGGCKVELGGNPCYEESTTTDGTKRVFNPNGDMWTGQLYSQYVKLLNPKVKYPLLFWHGGGLTGACWEATPDGRSGWQEFFLEQGYDVYVSDAVERGRAGWSKFPEIYKGKPMFRTCAQAWESFRIGPKYDNDSSKRKVYVGSQFPVEAFEASMMQAVPRWNCNNEAIQEAYDAYIRKVGPSIIVAHSQGCSFAAHAALHNPELVKAIVFVEPSSMPDTKVNDISKIKNIPQLFIWGDYLDCYETWRKTGDGKNSYYKAVARYFDQLQLLNEKVKWLELPDIGIYGNTHMLIQDKNNLQIARVVDDWLKKQNLQK